MENSFREEETRVGQLLSNLSREALEALGDPKSVELLYDIAKKLLDDQNKDSDTVTTRAGVVFGFSTLIAGSAGTVLSTLGAGSPLQLSVGAVIVTLYSVMAWNCASALFGSQAQELPAPHEVQVSAKIF